MMSYKFRQFLVAAASFFAIFLAVMGLRAVAKKPKETLANCR